jgi:transposase
MKWRCLTQSRGIPMLRRFATAVTNRALTRGFEMRINCHDLAAARDLLPTVPAARRLLADRAYDANSLRDWLAKRGTKAVIPPNPTRKHPHKYDAKACKGRNLIERMFCRLKDFRRFATRYDKRADNFLSAKAVPWLE